MATSDDNKKLEQEIEDYQMKQMINAIVRKHDSLYQEFQNYVENIKDNQQAFLPIRYSNLVTFLHMKNEEALIKKLLLEIAVRQLKEIGIKDLPKAYITALES